MADDEEAAVLACQTISCFIIVYYSSSQMKLIRFFGTAIITFRTHYKQTKLRIAPVALGALVVTCCVAIVVQHARHSTYDFSYTICMG